MLGSEDKLICSFKLVIDTAMGAVKKFVYDMDRPAILKGYLVGLCVDDNWEIWVQVCGHEMVSIFAIGA